MIKIAVCGIRFHILSGSTDTTVICMHDALHTLHCRPMGFIILADRDLTVQLRMEHPSCLHLGRFQGAQWT
jgi:hypothetical protein